MNRPLPRLPSPRSHLAGTLALVRCFSRLAGGHRDTSALLELLDRPDDLPAAVPDDDNGLKYDAYLARRPRGLAWGVTINDRFEGEAMHAAVRRFITKLSADHRLDALQPFREALDGADAVETLAIGFDHPDRPPRLKLYLQEDRWGAGVCTVSRLRKLAADLAPTCQIPGWLTDRRRVGVVTVELLAGGQVRLKAYLGGPDPLSVTAGAPREAVDLARMMRARSRLPGGFYYLTIRARPGRPNAYAMNRIYNHVQIGFSQADDRLHDAWLDVGRQFRAAGHRRVFDALIRAAGTLPGVRVVPTATALEAAGTSADVYCGAWKLGARA